MTIDLETLTLESGSHDDRDEGVCLLEAVAWWAGEAHSDHPACVSPVLAAFGRALNDILPAGKRQELVPLVPQLPGTAGDGFDERRAWMCVDWLWRTWVPEWLTVAGLTSHAAVLRDLSPIIDTETLTAGAAAGAAARDAARDALEPVVNKMQTSAIDLYTRMIREAGNHVA